MRARLLASLVLLASPAVANVHPNMERGFDPDAAFQTGQVDNVNLFNGSLTLAIPIGSRYPVNGGFSYGLTLTYNSNVWEFQEVLEFDDDTQQWEIKTEAYASRFWNAGLGWRLSLGELVDKNDALKNQTDRWMYVGPDGGAHVFYQQMHEGENDNSDEVLYTRDGSYLRLVVEPGQSFTSWKRIEFPDGTLHTFHKVSGTTWQLEEIQDRFGNFLEVAYVTGGVGSAEWQLTDNHDRLTRVLFEPAANLPPRVAQVILPKFGGGTAVWDFEYLNEIRGISEKDDYGLNNDRPMFSLLTKIELPDGSYYEMRTGDESGIAAYNDWAGPADISGTIQRLRLPTGGRLEWTYQSYDYPEGPKSWLDASTGVLERKLVRKGGAVEGKWIYANKRWRPSPSDPYDEVHTYVTMPQVDGDPGTCTKHYFAAPPDLEAGGVWKGWEYGLPFSWRQSQGSGADERFISTELWSESTVDGEDDRVCTGTKEVSTFLRFAHDKLPGGTGDDDKPNWYNTNRRVQIQATRYDSDGNLFTKMTYSDFDGIGHYRQSVVSGTLEDGHYPWSPITSVTHYNRSSGTYEIGSNNQQVGNYTPIPTTTPWILGIFDYQTTADAGVPWGPDLTRTNFSFDETTGFLDCVRRLEAGEDAGPNDVVELFGNDGAGNIAMHRIFGGDLVTLTGGTCATDGGFVSRANHTYSYGSRATTILWRWPGPEEFDYFSYDAVIDQNTGLVQEMEDPQGHVTTYDYDELGRPKAIEHDALADTFYTYTNVTPGAVAKVAIDQRTAAGDPLLRARFASTTSAARCCAGSACPDRRGPSKRPSMTRRVAWRACRFPAT